jgi:hypothetical protein
MKGGNMEKVTRCGYCGHIVTYDEAYDHVRTHLARVMPVVDVANFRARLARHVPVSAGRIDVQYAEPQPPQRMLVAAVRRAGGAINISGIYPVSPALVRWIARRAPEWRSNP